MFDKDNKFGFIINNNENNNNIKDTNLPYTISSKVLVTVPASDIKLGKIININNVSINKDRRYYIEFLGSKKLCSVMMSKETGDSIVCSIDDYVIQVFNRLTDLALFIRNTNAEDAPISTDLVIYEEEVKYLDSKYLENNLVAQNSISLGRTGDIGMASVAIGIGVEASGNGSFAQGGGAKASNNSAHAEGMNTIASGNSSHAEGNGTVASGTSSHAEGSETTASGEYGSHAEGYKTKAEGESSHAEGDHTTASGNSSHTEGSRTIASGIYSHAEGSNTTASGDYSHSEGEGTTASSQNQHVQGKYNIEDTNNKYAHIVGNGDIINKSNAHTLDWEGNAWYSGKLSQEGTPTEDKDLVTKKYVDDNAVNKYSQLNERPIEVFPYTEKLNKVTNVTQKLCTIDVADLKADTTYMCPDNCGRLVLQYTKLDNSKISFYMSYSPNSLIIQTGYKNDKQIEILIDGIVYTVTFKTATEEPKVEQTVRYLTDKNTTEYTPTGDYNPATKKYVDDNKEYINYNDKLTNNKITTLHISRNPVSCSTEINKKPLCELFPELLNMTYDTVFKKSISFKVNMDNFVKEYPTVKSAYNKIGINLYDENGNYIGNSYGSYINGDGLNIVYINTTQSIRFSAYFDKALAEGSNTSMETKNGYMTIQLSIPKGDNKKEFIDKIKDLKLSIIVFKTDFLNLNNESIYTPTSDYNPATKKYVDDKVASSPQLSFNESGELVVTINGVSKTFVPKE